MEKSPTVEKARIELVGSCSTLVLDQIWKTDPVQYILKDFIII
jgi:hypothetical protein